MNITQTSQAALKAFPRQCKIICSISRKVPPFETLRGGVLILVRWFVIYPWVYLMYNVKGLQSSPWRLDPRDRGRIDEPGILVTNHWNGLFDFLIAQVAVPRWASFLVDTRFTKIPGTKWFFQVLRGCPIFRRKPSLTQQLGVYERLANRLLQAGWVCLFPEGSSAARSEVGALKPGAARLALLAEEKAGWGLQLKIYTLGLNYENPEVSRSNVYAKWGRVLRVSDYRELFLSSPKEAEVALQRDITRSLSEVVLQASSRKELEMGHKRAFLQNDESWSGVERALNVRSFASNFGKENIVYRSVSVFLFSIFGIFGWPFRVFGRLCAKNPSEEAAYAMLLWSSCLVVGVERAGLRWIGIQAAFTWISCVTWLWAWRRGMPQAL